MQIRFGALAPPIHEQLGIPESECVIIEKASESVTYCSIHGILTDREANAARKRIMKLIDQKLRELENVS